MASAESLRGTGEFIGVLLRMLMNATIGGQAEQASREQVQRLQEKMGKNVPARIPWQVGEGPSVTAPVPEQQIAEPLPPQSSFFQRMLNPLAGIQALAPMGNELAQQYTMQAQLVQKAQEQALRFQRERALKQIPQAETAETQALKKEQAGAANALTAIRKPEAMLWTALANRLGLGGEGPTGGQTPGTGGVTIPPGQEATFDPATGQFTPPQPVKGNIIESLQKILPPGAALHLGPLSFTGQKGLEQIAQEEKTRVGAQQEMKPLPSADRKVIQQLLSVQESLDAVKDAFDPSLVGVGPGSLLDWRRPLPENFGGLPEQQIKMYRPLKGAVDTYLRAKSGAQINETEATRIENLFPRMTDDPVTFQRYLGLVQQEVTNMLEDSMTLAKTPATQLNITLKQIRAERAKRLSEYEKIAPGHTQESSNLPSPDEFIKQFQQHSLGQ